MDATLTTEFDVIRQISRIIAETADYREALRLSMECVANRVHVEACSVLVYNEAANKLVLEATYGLEQETVGHIQLSANEGITGYCFRSGVVVNTANKREHPEFHAFDSKVADRYKSLLAVPLVVGGRVVGVMDFERTLEQAFKPRTVEMVQAIASPLAVFILNASLAREVGNSPTTHPESRNRLRQALVGRPITDGVVRGRAYFISGAEVFDSFMVEFGDDVETEKRLLQRALEQTRQDTEQIQEEATDILAEADANIFFSHRMLLEDPTLIEKLNAALDEGFTLRFALKVVVQQVEKELRALGNELVLERLADVKDVLLRVLQAANRLRGVDDVSQKSTKTWGGRKFVIVARELLPSQLVRIPLRHVVGIVCEQGGTTTHVAILAKALHIPMLVGVADVTDILHPNDDIILDCNTGFCYARPTREIIRKFRPALAHYRQQARQTQADEPACEAMTADGTAVRLAGNVSLISELPLIRRYGAMGIGLYRTEFMFMIRGTYPSEDEQYRVFSRIVTEGGDSSVTIRVLDVGGDKPLPYVDFGHEDNPYLGWRGVRFLLSNPQFFQPHLRAILRTTVYGRVNILLPMVADLDELLQILEQLDAAKTSLRRDGIEFRNDFHLGVMLEVPSAVWALPDMLEHIDFVSLGTNDLTQYMFAVDRGNSRVSQWYRQFHPLVLKVIHETCRIVDETPGKRVSICGEIGGMPLGVPMLIGAGLRYFSMNPWRIPHVRRAIGNVSEDDCNTLLRQALDCRRDSDIVELMNAFADQHSLRGEV